MSRQFLLLSSLLCIVFFSCNPSKNLSKTKTGIGSLRFINEYDYPVATKMDGAEIGGLSDIEYDQQRNKYYMISDDPSARGAARFFTASISISDKGIDTVIFEGVTFLKGPDGKTYPDINKDRIHSVDLEAMKYDPTRDELVWSSEGQRVVRASGNEIENPAIVIINRNGEYKDSFELPQNLRMSVTEKGPRHNSVFEGVAFDESYSHLFVSVEEALYEDGLKAGTGDSTAWVRFLKFDRNTKKQVAQYAYQIDAVPYPANPPGAFKVNGISGILYAGNNKFIVIERGYSSGRTPSDVRVYLADLSEAEDISNNPSLKANPVKKPVTKTLLIDFDKSLNRYIDNIEGVTFGPNLSNGHRTLLFVADNNFDLKEKNQFLLFEILP